MFKNIQMFKCSGYIGCLLRMSTDTNLELIFSFLPAKLASELHMNIQLEVLLIFVSWIFYYLPSCFRVSSLAVSCPFSDAVNADYCE